MSFLSCGMRPNKRVPWRSARNHGQAITEFALVAPVAILILGVGVVGGQAFSTSINLASAARAGAAAAAYAAGNGSTTTQIQTAAQTAANAEYGSTLECPTSSGCVTVSPLTGAQSSIQMELVTVRETVDPFLPFFSNLTLSTSAAAEVNGQ